VSGKQKYYKYTQKKCPAKYTLTKIDSSGSSTQVRTFFPESHNHPPSPNPHINPDVKKQSLACLRVGALPANIHKQQVREASLSLSSTDVSTMGMLHKWKHRDAYKNMEPSMICSPIIYIFFSSSRLLDDIIANIMTHHQSFVRKIEMHPSVFIVAASDFGLRIFLI
jgi:hypothetical protein